MIPNTASAHAAAKAKSVFSIFMPTNLVMQIRRLFSVSWIKFQTEIRKAPGVWQLQSFCNAPETRAARSASQPRAACRRFGSKDILKCFGNQPENPAREYNSAKRTIPYMYITCQEISVNSTRSILNFQSFHFKSLIPNLNPMDLVPLIANFKSEISNLKFGLFNVLILKSQL